MLGWAVDCILPSDLLDLQQQRQEDKVRREWLEKSGRESGIWSTRDLVHRMAVLHDCESESIEALFRSRGRDVGHVYKRRRQCFTQGTTPFDRSHLTISLFSFVSPKRYSSSDDMPNSYESHLLLIINAWTTSPDAISNHTASPRVRVPFLQRCLSDADASGQIKCTNKARDWQRKAWRAIKDEGSKVTT